MSSIVEKIIDDYIKEDNLDIGLIKITKEYLKSI